MILSNEAIQEALAQGRLLIDPQPQPLHPGPVGGPECPYQTSAVDLRLHNEVSVYRKDTQPVVVDLSRGKFARFGHTATEVKKLTDLQPLNLDPGCLILGRTHETVALPLFPSTDGCLAARVEGKSSYARCGLLVHFTAPTIHAGFKGSITLEIMNLGPYAIVLRPLMPVCQLIIEEVKGYPFSNDSQFQDQTKPTG